MSAGRRSRLVERATAPPGGPDASVTALSCSLLFPGGLENRFEACSLPLAPPAALEGRVAAGFSVLLGLEYWLDSGRGAEQERDAAPKKKAINFFLSCYSISNKNNNLSTDFKMNTMIIKYRPD